MTVSDYHRLSDARAHNAHKPLAPFANMIDRTDDLMMIYSGLRAWDLAAPATDRVASLAFPRGRDAAEYSWPVRGKRVLVFACGEPRAAVDVLIVELLRQGATLVFARYTESADVVEYDPRRREVA